MLNPHIRRYIYVVCMYMYLPALPFWLPGLHSRTDQHQPSHKTCFQGSRNSLHVWPSPACARALLWGRTTWFRHSDVRFRVRNWNLERHPTFQRDSHVLAIKPSQRKKKRRKNVPLLGVVDCGWRDIESKPPAQATFSLCSPLSTVLWAAGIDWCSRKLPQSREEEIR